MSAASTAEFDEYVSRWWRLFAAALVLLIPLDLLTTLAAVTKHGTVVEANPLMRRLLEQGLLVATAVNLAVVCLVVVLFHVAIERLRHTPPTYHDALVLAVYGYLSVLLVAGTAVVANNILVLA